MDAYRYHAFMCTRMRENSESCGAQGSKELFQQFRQALKEGGVQGVKLTSCGCLGLCDSPGNMVVYPEGTWYSRITSADVPEIVEQHFKQGKPVERLAWPTPEALHQKMAEVREKHMLGH